MTRFFLDGTGSMSRGGGVLIRNLAELLPNLEYSGPEIRIIARNFPDAPASWRSRYILIPQNALPWSSPVGTLSERTKVLAMRGLTDMGVRRADGVVHISEAVLPSEPPASRIAHNVLDAEFEDVAKQMPGPLGGRPYVVSVGSLHSYRNTVRLISAYRTAKDRGLVTDLVIAGWPHPAAIRKIREAAHRVEGVVLIEREVSRAEALSLMRNAELCVFPSLCEASPVSVLEAVALTDNVILSDIPGHLGVLRSAKIDVAQEALFDPLSAPDMARALLQPRPVHGDGLSQLRNPRGRQVVRREWGERMASTLSCLVEGVSSKR